MPDVSLQPCHFLSSAGAFSWVQAQEEPGGAFLYNKELTGYSERSCGGGNLLLPEGTTPGTENILVGAYVPSVPWVFGGAYAQNVFSASKLPHGAHVLAVLGAPDGAICLIIAELVLCTCCSSVIMLDMAMKHDIINDDPILTTEEVAQMLAVSKMTVRRWIENGVIQRGEWFRPGKDYRIYARAVRRLRGEEPAA